MSRLNRQAQEDLLDRPQRGTTDSDEFVCPLCDRGGVKKTEHHLIPKSRGGKEKLDLCRDCHKAIHACFSNKELEREFHTIPRLLGRETFRKMVAFISKQDPGGKLRIERPKDQRYRRRGQ